MSARERLNEIAEIIDPAAWSTSQDNSWPETHLELQSRQADSMASAERILTALKDHLIPEGCVAVCANESVHAGAVIRCNRVDSCLKSDCPLRAREG